MHNYLSFLPVLPTMIFFHFITRLMPNLLEVICWVFSFLCQLSWICWKRGLLIILLLDLVNLGGNQVSWGLFCQKLRNLRFAYYSYNDFFSYFTIKLNTCKVFWPWSLIIRALVAFVFLYWLIGLFDYMSWYFLKRTYYVLFFHAR